MAEEESKIKAIIFDIGGVLALDAPKYFMGELSIKRDIPVDDLVTAWRKYWVRFKLGEITEDEFWTSFAGELLIKEPQEQLVQELKDMIRLFLVPNDDVFNYAKSLKSKFKIGILSNTTKEWVTYHNEHFQLDADFDAAVYSCAVHAVKPEKHIYEVVVTKLGVKPDQCVFVDNHERNLGTAKELGMHTVLFKNLDQLKSDLQKIIGGT